MREFRFTFPLENGLHARPASHLAEQAAAFGARIGLRNERTGISADARSVLELVATNTAAGDACVVTFDGADETAAHGRLADWLERVLPGCDEPVEDAGGTGKLPRALVEIGVGEHVAGIGVSPGIGTGVALRLDRGEIPESAFEQETGPADAELRRYEEAIVALSAAYDAELDHARGRDEREVIKAHRSLLRDPALARRIEAGVASGLSAARAAQKATADFAQELSGAESAYLRERVMDLHDVGARLVRGILGIENDDSTPELAGPTVIIAESLSPARFLALDRSKVAAILIGDGGTTSHTVLLAKSFGIPAICGLGAETAKLPANADVIVDARAGVAIPNPPEAVRGHYAGRLAHQARMAEVRRGWAKAEARTADGERVLLMANVASAEEAEAAFEQGADGIGLFRTEMLFFGKSLPAEDEQAAIYERAVRAAAGRPVTFRTLDAGGDKPVPGLTVAGEENPFLGRRGVRLYAEHADVVKTQLRAMLRAAAAGSANAVKIMFPMIACVEEMRLCRELLAQAAEETGGIPRDAVSAGMMVEVPSAAFAVPELSAAAEFFSIGSNDLSQYFFAADRGDAALRALQSPFHPPFARVLRQIVDAADAAGRPVGICGNMAGEPEALALLVGLGLRQLSVPAPDIAAIKAALADLERDACRETAAAVAASGDEAAARMALGELRRPAKPWLEPALVLLDVDGDSKPAVIREMIDALELAGRVSDADALEQAIWEREDTYATGFGNGFAIPHAKTDAVAANSIVVARLRDGIEWGSLDDRPVRVVLMMAVRESQKNEHLRNLAKLSRLLMREPFRERLSAEPSPEALAAFVLESLS